MTNRDHGDAARAELASALWRERELLEGLQYALTCQHLVLSSGGIRWLTQADEQVRAAVAAVTECELQRALVTHDVALGLGLSPDATLDAIASAADAPWDALLADHRDALRTLVAEIGTLTAENRRLLQAGSDLARETLARVGSATAGFDLGGPAGPDYGSPSGGSIGPVLLDRQA